MLFPAMAWLFVQFSMSGVMLSSSAGAMQIEICSPFGIQQISIDPETGEPVEPVIGGGCGWCQSFGVTIDTLPRKNVPWSAFECDFTRLLPTIAPMHTPLRLVADFRSRAPPFL